MMNLIVQESDKEYVEQEFNRHWTEHEQAMRREIPGITPQIELCLQTFSRSFFLRGIGTWIKRRIENPDSTNASIQE